MSIEPKQLKKQRTELFILFAMPIVGIVLMTAYYYYVIDSNTEVGTHNKGVLITPPKPGAELALRAGDAEFVLNDGSGKWSFVVVGGANCEKACQEKLYLTRQIREALGKYKLRVRDVYLSTESVNDATAALFVEGGEYSSHTLVNVDESAFSAWANQSEPALDILPEVHFYVVDPAGWFMMFYNTEHNYKQVISDMKFLIKNS